MSNQRKPTYPFLQENDGETLAGIVNRLAESFDVAGLSYEESIMAVALLDRMMSALWKAHPGPFRIYLYMLLYSETNDLDDDDDSSDVLDV